MDKFMLTGSEDAPAASQLWSWKKILAWLLGVMVVFISVILAYDEKLQPHPELKQHLRAMPLEAGNGYLLLNEAWQNWPAPDRKVRQRWNEMERGREPWDNTVAEALNPGGRDLAADLGGALKAPDWMVPVRSTGHEDRSPIPRGIEALRAAAFQRLLDGHAEPALTLIADLRRLARRQIEGANDGRALAFGCMPDFDAATLTAQILTMVPLDDAALASLAGCWAEDQLSQEDFGPPVAGHGKYFEACLEEGADLLYLRSLQKWWYKLTTKRNRTINRMNQILSAICTDSLGVASQRDLSLYGETDRLKQFIDNRNPVLDSNHGGNLTTMATFTFFDYGPRVFITLPRQKLFAARAARVAVALKRWQRTREGQLPRNLTELAPGFLPAVPQDPWNGLPIQWDSSTSVLFAVGEDWKPASPDPAEFGFSGLGLSIFNRTRFSLDRSNAAPPPLPPALKP